MKTSLEIEDALYRAAKIRAAERGTSVRALIEEGLRRVLQEPNAEEDPPRPTTEGAGAEASDPVADKRSKLMRLIEDFRRLPVIDDRTPEEIVGYNAWGDFE